MSFHDILHGILHAVSDSIPILPFLFLTYLLMELLEHKAGDKVKTGIAKAGKLGPLLGALLGLVPQCGFSALAAGLYAGRVVSIGTLLSVFLATSDEMIPVLLGAGVPAGRMLTILALKLVIAAAVGFVADLLLARYAEPMHVSGLCEEEHCHCEEGVLRSALHHTVHVFGFVLILNVVLGVALELVDGVMLASLMQEIPVLGESVAALIGLIPNCAASVAIATLYAKGVLGAGAMLSGLLTGAGAGILVLIRTNHRKKQNILIVAAMLCIGIFFGVLLDLTGLGAALSL